MSPRGSNLSSPTTSTRNLLWATAQLRLLCVEYVWVSVCGGVHDGVFSFQACMIPAATDVQSYFPRYQQMIY